MAKASVKKPAAKTPSDYPYKGVNNLLNKLQSFKKVPSSRNFYIVLGIILLLLLAVYKKSWFIAATVNGIPIINLELQMRLNDLYRSKTLDQLITEKIILNEAAKNNALASDAEVNKKIADIENQVGGAQAFDTLLSQQRESRANIRQPIKVQLSMEKLYSKDATVSAEEVAKFIEANKDQLRATDSAGQQQEAYNAIKNQKLSQIFAQKYQDLRSKAKIQIF